MIINSYQIFYNFIINIKLAFSLFLTSKYIINKHNKIIKLINRICNLLYIQLFFILDIIKILYIFVLKAISYFIHKIFLNK